MQRKTFLNILQGRGGHCDEGFHIGRIRQPKGFEIKARGDAVIVVLLDLFSPTGRGPKRQTAFLSLTQKRRTWEIAEQAFSWGNHELAYLLRENSSHCAAMHDIIAELENRVCLVDCGPLRPRRFHRKSPRAPYQWEETQTIDDPADPIAPADLKNLIAEKKKKKNEVLIRDFTEARDTHLAQGRQVLNVVFVNNHIQEVKQMVIAGSSAGRGPRP